MASKQPTTAASAPIAEMSAASDHPYLACARRVLELETQAVGGLLPLLDARFVRAVEMILGCAGRVVVTGIGKPGFIAQKISATLASTGTPSLFLHPAEALHGDLGRVVRDDVVLALSNSGETEEILRLLPSVRRIGAPVIAITGDARSAMAAAADVVIDIGPIEEACPMGLAPTTSSLALLAIGDALAMTVLEQRGFSTDAYALLHPGGKLGRRLMKVDDLMRKGRENPIVREDAPLSEVIATMTRTPGRPGAAAVVGADGRLAGIFTDGDLRRLVERGACDFTRPVQEAMGKNPRTAAPDQLVSEAAALMRDARLDQLVVVDAAGAPVGLLDVQDLLAARIL